jgi:hypothetical protein
MPEPKDSKLTEALAQGVLDSLSAIKYPDEETRDKLQYAVDVFQEDMTSLQRNIHPKADGTYSHTDALVVDVTYITSRSHLRDALSKALAPVIEQLALSFELNEQQLKLLIENDALINTENPFTGYFSRRESELQSKKPRTSPLDAVLDKLKTQFLNKQGNNWSPEVSTAINQALGKNITLIPYDKTTRRLFIELLLETSLNRFYDFAFQVDIKKRLEEQQETMPEHIDTLMALGHPGVTFSNTSTLPLTFEFEVGKTYVDITAAHEYGTATIEGRTLDIAASHHQAICDVTTRVGIIKSQVKTEEIQHEAFFEDTQIDRLDASSRTRPKSTRPPARPRSPQSILNVPGEELLPQFVEQESHLLQTRSAASMNMKNMANSLEFLSFKKTILDDTIKHLKQETMILALAQNVVQVKINHEKKPYTDQLISLNNQIERRTKKREAAGLFKRMQYAISDAFRRFFSGETVVDEFDRLKQEFEAKEETIQTKHQAELDNATNSLEKKNQELIQQEDKLEGLMEELDKFTLEKTVATDTRQEAATALKAHHQTFKQARDALIQDCKKRKDPTHQALVQFLENPTTPKLFALEHVMLTKHRPNQTLEEHLERAGDLYAEIGQATHAMHTLNSPLEDNPLSSIRGTQHDTFSSDIVRLKQQIEELKQENPSTVTSAIKWARKEKYTQAEEDVKTSLTQKKTMLEKLRQQDQQDEHIFQSSGDALIMLCDAIEHPVDYVLKALLESPTTAALKALEKVMQDNPDYLKNDALVDLIEKAGDLYPAVKALLEAQRIAQTSVDTSVHMKAQLSGLNPDAPPKHSGPNLTSH